MLATTAAMKPAIFGRSFTAEPSSFTFPGDHSSLAALREGRRSLASFVENDYHLLTPQERMIAFEIISDPSFIKKHAEDYLLLKARFNPANQYRVKTFYQGKENVYQCFSFEGKFFTGAALFLNESKITEVERIA